MRHALRTCLTATALAVAAFSGQASGDEITNSVGIKLQLLESGRFEMGDGDLGPVFYKDHSEFNSAGDDKPVHPVVLTKPFYLAKTEVTVAQFREFVQATKYQTSAEKNPRGAVGWDPTPPENNPRFVATFRDEGGFHWKNPGFEQGDNHPVVGVSFADAKAYCAWLSEKEDVTYRLPTEAEWEYAARAGTETFFSFGNQYHGTIQKYANIGNVELENAFPDRVRRQWLIDVESDPADQHVYTAPVGSYEANPWGLFDLYGNAWEWCEDRYLDTTYMPYSRPGYQQLRKRAIDPLNLERGSSDGDWRVIRGGSWFNAPIQCRSGCRGFFEADDAACYIGFRIARDAAPEAITASRGRFEESEAARTTIEQAAERGQLQERRDGRLTLLIRRESLSDEVYGALTKLDHPIDIYLNGEGRLTGADIAKLALTPQLTGLLLPNAGSELVDADFAPLVDHTELELLQMTGTPKLTDQFFEHLKNLKRLELLHLESELITDAGLQLLPELDRLTTLHLGGTMSEGGVLKRFRSSPLQTLSCSHLTDAGAQDLVAFQTLRDLSIGNSPLTGRSLTVIAGLPLLSRLILSNCEELKDEDFTILENLGELRTLDLRGTQAGSAAVTGIMGLNNLRDLSLGSPQLSNTAVRHLCEMVSLNSLTVTEDATAVTDAGLADLWRLSNLRTLSVNAPQLSSKCLATLGELPKLDWLQVSGTGIDDLALKYASQSETLRYLTVRTTAAGGLTDAGLLQLAEARGLVQLELPRSDTAITDEGVEQLRSQRPQLRVNLR